MLFAIEHKILKGRFMLIDKKVERYVESVVVFVPASMRARAARDVTDMVNDMIRDYASGREPDILDARAVIKLLGSPEEIALTWLATNEDRKHAKKEGSMFGIGIPWPEFLSSARTQRYLSAMLSFFTVLSVALIVAGILALGTHVISTMLPVFVGLVLALVSMTGKGVLIRQY